MENPNRQAEDRAAAARLNKLLADDLTRYKRKRLLLTLTLAAAAIGSLFIKQTIMFAPPCILGAFIMYLLYQDARGQLQLVKSRNWRAPSPRIGRLGKPPTPPVPDATTRV